MNPHWKEIWSGFLFLVICGYVFSTAPDWPLELFNLATWSFERDLSTWTGSITLNGIMREGVQPIIWFNNDIIFHLVESCLKPFDGSKYTIQPSFSENCEYKSCKSCQNIFTKLKRYKKYTSAKYTLEVWKLLVIAFGKHIASGGLRTLCNGPETLTQWTS